MEEVRQNRLVAVEVERLSAPGWDLYLAAGSRNSSTACMLDNRHKQRTDRQKDFEHSTQPTDLGTTEQLKEIVTCLERVW